MTWHWMDNNDHPGEWYICDESVLAGLDHLHDRELEALCSNHLVRINSRFELKVNHNSRILYYPHTRCQRG
jgi:hypothetical protein